MQLEANQTGQSFMLRARLQQLLPFFPQPWERCAREAEERCPERALPQLVLHKLLQRKQWQRRQWNLVQMLEPQMELVPAHVRQFCRLHHGRGSPP